MDMQAPAAGRLSREVIAETALGIIDREGVEAATVRRVARELDAAPMSLYGHVANKQDLLDAVVDLAVRDAELPALTRDWRRDLESLFTGVHLLLSEHPAIVRIRFLQPVVRPDALRLGEAGMAILAGAGFEPAEAAACFRLLFTYTLGFAGLSPSDDVGQARRTTAASIAILEPEAYPHLHAAADEFSEAVAGDEFFVRGLKLVIAGIDAFRP
jgi:AcrR family transcriptional regulator